MSAPARVVVSGATGRMGRAIAGRILADPGLELSGGLDRPEAREGVAAPIDVSGLATLEIAGDLLEQADILIDFSAPAFLSALLERHRERLRGTAIVVGTTGLGAGEERLLDRAAEGSPVLTAANFSVGVNVLLVLAERAVAALGEEFDIEIVEAHHRRKEDAPSGTALALGRAAAAGRGLDLDAVRRDGRSGRPGRRPDAEIGFHALRGGEVVGDHHVHLIGELERLELTHRASSRDLFAAGAIRAAHWLRGREPGRYQMRQVLGF